MRFVRPCTSIVLLSVVLLPVRAFAQQTDPHAGHQMEKSSGWKLMQDGIVMGLFNHQGGPRGGNEFKLPNWWMGMWMKEKGKHQLNVSAMLSLDPATVGKNGYREIFQVGEALDGKPLIDRQHPHDLFMQFSALWRVSLGEHTSLAIAGGPSGEPTLGPVAFMHRPSAAGLALAPLGHHTFDSTHISYGVVSASLDLGRWTFEGSAFNGREPDEQRWDFDLGKLDSTAGRLWFRPSKSIELQVSSGRLREPEELIEGDVVRTTTSASWYQPSEGGMKAVTVGYGVNAAHGGRRHGVFGELNVERNKNSAFGRLELQQVESYILITGDVPDDAHGEEPAATVGAVTIGAARTVTTWKGFEGSIAAQATFYRVPEVLRATHGRPVSAQVFFRLRLPSGPMGRMWGMKMSRGH